MIRGKEVINFRDELIRGHRYRVNYRITGPKGQIQRGSFVDNFQCYEQTTDRDGKRRKISKWLNGAPDLWVGQIERVEEA